MANVSCMQCRFCGVLTMSDKTLAYVCRRHPPTINSNVVPGGGGLPTLHNQILWPSVTKSDWCGEYEAQLNG